MPLPAFIPALVAALKVAGAAAKVGGAAAATGAGATGAGVATAAPVAAGMATAPAIAGGVGSSAPAVMGKGMASGFGSMMSGFNPMQFMGGGQQQSQNKQPAMQQMGYLPSPTPQAPPDLASLLASYQQGRRY